MTLRAVSVSRCLDKRLMIAGFDIPDLLAVFFLLSILNFIFGRTDSKIFLVWLPTLAVAILLRVTKRGKPENYLVHFVRYYFREKNLSAFEDASKDIVVKNHIKNLNQGANHAKP